MQCSYAVVLMMVMAVIMVIIKVMVMIMVMTDSIKYSTASRNQRLCATKLVTLSYTKWSLTWAR